MAQMRLEINTAGSDLESLASVVLHNCVVTVRATQTTLNVGLVCIDARGGSLCKPQRDQQGRYNDQQECSLHGILRRFLALRRSENFAWDLILLPILISNARALRAPA